VQNVQARMMATEGMMDGGGWMMGRKLTQGRKGARIAAKPGMVDDAFWVQPSMGASHLGVKTREPVRTRRKIGFI